MNDGAHLFRFSHTFHRDAFGHVGDLFVGQRIEDGGADDGGRNAIYPDSIFHHSYDLRIPSAPKVQDVTPHVVIINDHTAEEVLVAGQGPGAEKVKGYFPNTRLFHIMMEAYGW